jgi:protein CpxP
MFMTMAKMMGRAAMMLVGGALLTVLPAMAQDTTAAPPPPAAGHAHGHAKHGGPMAEALAGLNLTPDQQKVADDAQADGATKMKALRDDSTLDQKAKGKQMHAIQQDEMTKVRAVLTDDQKAKLDTALAQMKEQHKDKHEGGATGDASMPPPPPPPAQ